MTQKDKELLLKDLCSRLPYNTICQVEFKNCGKYETKNMTLSGIFKDEAYFTIENGSVYSNNYKPYLFPISSMSEEEAVKYIISDLKEMPSLAELGGWQKCAKYVLEEIGDISTISKIEIVNAIVGKIFEYSKKEEQIWKQQKLNAVTLWWAIG